MTGPCPPGRCSDPGSPLCCNAVRDFTSAMLDSEVAGLRDYIISSTIVNVRLGRDSAPQDQRGQVEFVLAELLRNIDRVLRVILTIELSAQEGRTADPSIIEVASVETLLDDGEITLEDGAVVEVLIQLASHLEDHTERWSVIWWVQGLEIPKIARRLTMAPGDVAPRNQFGTHQAARRARLTAEQAPPPSPTRASRYRRYRPIRTPLLRSW